MNRIIMGSRKSHNDLTFMFDPGNVTAIRVNPDVMLDLDMQYIP